MGFDIHGKTAGIVAAGKIGRCLIEILSGFGCRGALIDTQALLDGLKSGKIGYAGLDVYEEESDYFFEDYSDRVMTDDLLARLTTFNNVVVTSHQAFLTKEALTNIADITFENIREFKQRTSDTPLTNQVIG